MPNVLHHIYQPLASPEDIAAWDTAASRDYALPVSLLMENAGRAAFYTLKGLFDLKPETRILVLAGGGNNGGDGLVLARYLHNAGCRVAVRCLKRLDAYKGPAGQHLRVVRKAGVFVERLRRPEDAVQWITATHKKKKSTAKASQTDGATETALAADAMKRLNHARKTEILSQTLDGRSSFARAGVLPPPGLDTPPGLMNLAKNPPDEPQDESASPDIIVDALFGCGFHAPLREDAVSIIRTINSHREAFVFAVDIPSGLHALNGTPEPEAVRANATVTFASAKPGLSLPWSKPYTGFLRIAEIGLPLRLTHSKAPTTYRLVAPYGEVLPPIPSTAHKGEKGSVLIIGGSEKYTGAPALSALGALRSGAGLVTVAAPAGLCNQIKGVHPEIMALPLYGNESAEQPMQWSRQLIPALLQAVDEFFASGKNRRAIVLGPGLGRSDGVLQIFRALLEYLHHHPDYPPMLIDADALFFLRAGNTTGMNGDSTINLNTLRSCDVITPHPGEMVRIASGLPDMPETFPDFASRSAVLRAVCASTPAAVVLKGPGTLIGQATLPQALVPFAEANLGVGGSGDVLSGVIARLLALEIPAPEAGALGAHIHGRAGVISRRNFPAGGALASDIVACLPEAMRELYWA